MPTPRFAPLALLMLAASVRPAPATEAPIKADAGPTVGMPAKIEQLILPGPELEARPLEDRQAKVVLRVVDVFPHGSAYRYNLAFYGLEPGTYDLRDYLRRKDDSPTADLPPIPVTIRAILPPGQVVPNALEATPTAFRGWYRPLMALAAVAWLAGFIAILLVGRRQIIATNEAASARVLSFADRLRPLVEGAMAGSLAEGQHAELERMLIDYWRRRLGLDLLPPARAIAEIRADPTAGALLRQLEAWLHQPPGSASEVDVPALLEPYRSLPDETPMAAGGRVA